MNSMEGRTLGRSVSLRARVGGHRVRRTAGAGSTRKGEEGRERREVARKLRPKRVQGQRRHTAGGVQEFPSYCVADVRVGPSEDVRWRSR